MGNRAFKMTRLETFISKWQLQLPLGINSNFGNLYLPHLYMKATLLHCSQLRK